MLLESQKRAMRKHDHKHTEELAEKRREYYKSYNATRPKVEITEEARIAHRDYMREYRQRAKNMVEPLPQKVSYLDTLE